MSYPQFGYPYSPAPQVKGLLQRSERGMGEGRTTTECHFPQKHVLNSWALVLAKHGLWGRRIRIASKVPLADLKSLLFNPQTVPWGTLGNTWARTHGLETPVEDLKSCLGPQVAKESEA